MRRIFQLNSELYKVTGIQKVILDIHAALCEMGSVIVGTIPYSKVDSSLGILKTDYIQLGSYKMFRHSIVIIHERKYLPIFWFLNKILRYDVKLIYVHHNELYGHKLISLFPDHIVAISDSGINNLTEYFNVPLKNITKIYNCVSDTFCKAHLSKTYNPNNINILYPARINSVKRQTEIVDRLSGKLNKKIQIYFAGIGPDYIELKKKCNGSEQFISLGFCEDMNRLMGDMDYVMLFSKHEGLPISLIEATKSGLPIICNNVGGNCEIAHNGKNAIVVNDWEQLIDSLNDLPNIKEDVYDMMKSESITIYQSSFTFEKFSRSYRNLIIKLCQN